MMSKNSKIKYKLSSKEEKGGYTKLNLSSAFSPVKFEQLKSSNKMFTMTFFGKEVRIYEVDEHKYFVIEDILALVSPTDISVESIKYTDNYDEVKNSVTKIIDRNEVSDANGILKIIREVVGTFPGPLSTWLTAQQ